MGTRTLEEVLVDGAPGLFLDDHAGRVKGWGRKLRANSRSVPSELRDGGKATHCDKTIALIPNSASTSASVCPSSASWRPICAKRPPTESAGCGESNALLTWRGLRCWRRRERERCVRWLRCAWEAKIGDGNCRRATQPNAPHSH